MLTLSHTEPVFKFISNSLEDDVLSPLKSKKSEKKKIRNKSKKGES
jgi:hypothetical protein